MDKDCMNESFLMFKLYFHIIKFKQAVTNLNHNYSYDLNINYCNKSELYYEGAQEIIESTLTLENIKKENIVGLYLETLLSCLKDKIIIDFTLKKNNFDIKK